LRTTGLIFLLSGIFIWMGSVNSSYAQERIALVIGNSGYEYAPSLPNPRNDADAIGNALEAVGFEVTIHTDLDQRGMQSALRDFGLRAETSDVALVYFAGHGIQVASQNYLLPVDAQLRRERDLIYEATPLSIVTAEVAQARQLGMVILDACRDNPLADNLRQSLGPVRSKLIGLGMARVEDVPTDTLIAFSTRFNQLAYDGAGDLSPFTSALVEHIEEPGLELNLFFRKVRDTVLDLTANRQEPRTLDALGAKPFYFTAPKSNQPPSLGEIQPLIVEDGADATIVEIDAPKDADNDQLSIEVMGLPSFGLIESGEEAVTFGDELTIDELKTLTYRPEKGKLGEAGAFLFVVRDGQGGVTAGRVPIDVIRSNEVPVVAETQELVWPSIPLNINPPTDPDGDPLTITVLAVPSLGDITNGEQVVSVEDKLSVDELASLMLDPSQGVTGEFAYEVADDHGGVSTASVTMQLPGIDGMVQVAEEMSANEIALADEQALTESSAPQMRNTSPEVPADQTVLSGVPEEQAEPTVVETLTASNIRDGPGSDASWVTSVPAGTQLKSIEHIKDIDWYQIELADGQKGFISGSLVRASENDQPIEVAVATDDVIADPPAKPETQTDEAVQVTAVDPTSLPSEELKECDDCPVMITLPTGSFQMGSNDGELAEQPVRSVSVDGPIALGKYEVTVAEWQACASSGFCRKISDPTPDDDKRPVQNISWADAESFIAWLRKETEQPYRLPTEAEWEYAARGGKASKYWWGDIYEDGQANCANCGGEWDRKRPADIGSYQPNPFGLHDMYGGVSEWVADCWIGHYRDAPGNADARTESFCPQRVLRGGSWRSELDDITSSSRFRYDAQVSYYTNGFRVARDLN